MPDKLPTIQMSKDLTDNKWGRCASIKPGASTSERLYPWFWNPNQQFALADGVSCYGKSVDYSHGGLSLQECLTLELMVTRCGSASGKQASREDTADSDLDELARDQIASLISARFKGHGLTRLIEGILKAQGYTTYRSPEGADGGADILAGSGPLGFSAPRLCIEVKSEDNPIGREPVDKLLGAMTKFNADQGLFVAWGGFKGNVQKEMASQFFRLRLWTQKEILEQLFEQYDRLDEDLKAELPLKRVWMVTSQEEIL